MRAALGLAFLLTVAGVAPARAQDAAGNTDVPADLAQREAREEWERARASATQTDAETASTDTASSEAETERTSASKTSTSTPSRSS